MKKSMNRTNRSGRNSRNTSTEVGQSKHYNKVSKNSDEIKDTGPIIFDMPEIEAQEIDGRIVVKMGGRIVDGSQIPQQIETYYRDFDAVCREYMELAEPL